MMEGTNREWLNKMSLYDLLLMMENKRRDMQELDVCFCVLDLLVDGTLECNVGNRCKNCIAEWLNKKRG